MNQNPWPKKGDPETLFLTWNIKSFWIPYLETFLISSCKDSIFMINNRFLLDSDLEKLLNWDASPVKGTLETVRSPHWVFETFFLTLTISMSFSCCSRLICSRRGLLKLLARSIIHGLGTGLGAWVPGLVRRHFRFLVNSFNRAHHL